MKVEPLGCSSAEICDPGIKMSNTNTNTQIEIKIKIQTQMQIQKKLIQHFSISKGPL